MKSRNDMRIFIGVTWLISFIGMWAIFSMILPEKEFEIQLNKLEQSVSKKDWSQAKKGMDKLQRIYSKNRFIIQANNATEILTTFDLTMGQLYASVQHEQDAALEYIGGLKASMDFVMKSFSGP